MQRARTLPKTQFVAKRILSHLPVYIMLTGFAFIFLLPFIYMISTSLKSPVDLYDPTVKWIPRHITLQNFKSAAFVLDFWDRLKTSLLVTLTAVIGQVLSCSLIAYGFARFRFRLRNALFMLVLFSVIVPPQTIIIPSYINFSNMNMLGTFLPVIVPCFFGMGLNGAIFIFIFRQFYKGLPTDLEDAATIDGCGFLKTFWKIILPTSRTSLLVVFILSFIWHWNDYFEPAMYLIDVSRGTLTMYLEIMETPIAMQKYMDQYTVAVKMACTLLTILPVMIMYAFLNRKFIQGIEYSGLAN